MALLRRSSLPPGRQVRPGSMACLALGCALASLPAAAQQGTTVIGGSGQPSVVVNLDALDRLGGTAPGARLHLVMPQAEVAVIEPGMGGLGGIPPLPTARPSGLMAAVIPPAPVLAPAASAVAPAATTAAMASADAQAAADLAAAVAAEAAAASAATAAATAAAVPEAEPVPAQPLPEATAVASADAVQAPEPTLPALPEPEQATASLEPSGSMDLATPGVALSLPFEPGEAEVSPQAQAPLSQLAASLGGDEAVRVQLMAYADGTGVNASQARRLSLTRALAVRSYLLQQGVRSTRIDVRALGADSQGGAPDRVDVVVLPR